MAEFQIIPVAEASVLTLMKSIDKVIINPIIFFMFACAVAYFLYGVAQYLLSPGNEEVRKKSKSVMIWGVVGLFIMVAVFGIMRLILGTVGEKNIKINNNGDYIVDKVQVDSNGNFVPTNPSGPLADKNITDNLNTNKDITGGSIDVDNNKNTPDLPDSTFTTSPFPVYKPDDLCWNNHNAPVTGQGDTEYYALNNAKDRARQRYLFDNGVLSTDATKANYPQIFASEVLYNKKFKIYYAWLDARAPIGKGTIANCNLTVVSPAPVIPQAVVFSREADIGGNIVDSHSVTDFTKDPFTQKYVANNLCWQRDIPSDPFSTEYQALENVKAKARAQYLKDNPSVDPTKFPNLPTTYGTLTNYDPSTKNYYAWLDVRAPINSGKASDCNLVPIYKVVSESKKKNPLTHTYVSDKKFYRVVDSGADPDYSTSRNIAISNALIQIAQLKGVTSTADITSKTILEEKYYEKDTVTGNYDYFVAIESPK